MKNISTQAKKLVIERIKASSHRLKISAGHKEFTRKELIQSVQKGNKLGKEIVKTHLRFLQDIAAGKIHHHG